MSKRFRDRIVVITGASAGIGRAAAAAFAAQGATVAGVARSRERLEELSRRIGGPGRLLPVVADVTDARSMEAMAARVLAEMGVPDVVVANAGQGLDARVVVTSDEAIHRILEINVVGVYRTLRPFIPAMIERGSGRLLMISSVVGKRGIPHLSAYCASKFALHGLADSLRAEMHGTGVSVGVVCPSTTDSEFSERLLRSGPSQRPVRITRHSAESVARAILRMARSRRPEMVLSAEGKFMVFVDTFAPRVADFFLAKALNRPR